MAAGGSGEDQPINRSLEKYGATDCNAGHESPCPMEPETYKAICDFMGRDPEKEFPDGQFGPNMEFKPCELMIRQDFAKNKVRWTDDYYGDRWRFLQNMHPVLALFRSHRLHMVSRNERICVYVVQLFWFLFVSLTFIFAGRCGTGLCSTVGAAGVGEGHPCVFPFIHKGETYEHCTHDGRLVAWCSTATDSDGNHIAGKWGNCWCKSESDELGGQCPRLDSSIWQNRRKEKLHAVLCCFASWTGVAWFTKTFFIFGTSLGGTLYASVLNTFFALGSFQLMICGCVQRASPFARQFGEALGHVIYGLLTILILLPQPYLIMFCYNHGMLLATFGVFLSGKIASYASLTVLQVIVFHFAWNHGGSDRDDVEWLRHVNRKDGREVFEDEEKNFRICGCCSDPLDQSRLHVTCCEYENWMRSRTKAS